MKSRQLIIAALIAALCSVSNINAATMTVSIDGDSANVPLRPYLKPNGQIKFLVGATADAEPFVFQTANGKIVIDGELDPDPAINFGGAAFDFGAPSNFSVMMVLPLSSPLSNPSQVFDSFSGSVTNASGSGVTVTANAPPAGIPEDGDGVREVEVYTLSDNGGATWKNVGHDLMPSTSVPLPVNGSGSTGSYNEGFAATIPGGPWTHMRADVNFGLSGGGDIFTFNGAKVLSPEPSAVVLLLLSLAAFGFLRPIPRLR